MYPKKLIYTEPSINIHAQLVGKLGKELIVTCFMPAIIAYRAASGIKGLAIILTCCASIQARARSKTGCFLSIGRVTLSQVSQTPVPWVTQVEKTSRLLMLDKLPNPNLETATNVMQALTNKLYDIAKPMRKMLFYDHGKKMKLDKQLSANTDMAFNSAICTVCGKAEVKRTRMA